MANWPIVRGDFVVYWYIVLGDLHPTTPISQSYCLSGKGIDIGRTTLRRILLDAGTEQSAAKASAQAPCTPSAHAPGRHADTDDARITDQSVPRIVCPRHGGLSVVMVTNRLM